MNHPRDYFPRTIKTKREKVDELLFNFVAHVSVLYTISLQSQTDFFHVLLPRRCTKASTTYTCVPFRQTKGKTLRAFQNEWVDTAYQRLPPTTQF